MAYPFGIADIWVQDLIDIDECGFLINIFNHTGDSLFQGVGVREAGMYSKTEKKNVLLATSGDPAGYRWKMTWMEGEEK